MESQNRLVESARKALKHAYSPYSHFSVGAAIMTKEGKIFTGCNIENVSYSLAMCAERIALFKAISEGHRSFDSLAISSSGSKAAFPCGACRQVLMEFNPDLKIFLDRTDSNYLLSDLQPNAFTRDQMILNERDRKILDTRYLELLCQKTQENEGKQSRFSKTEVYGTGNLDAYNQDLVIPLIIRKLWELGYVEEHENNEIAITPLGKKMWRGSHH